MSWETEGRKGDAPRVRFRDTGTSGKEYAWLHDAGKVHLQENTGTEGAPTWTTRTTLDTGGKFGIGSGAATPHSTLQVAGSHAFAHTDVSTATFAVTDEHSMLHVNSSGTAVTINLPTAVGIAGRCLCIVKISSDANAVTIDASGTQTIDGELTKAFSSQYAGMCIESDGANWVAMPGGLGRVTKRIESAVFPALGAAAPTQVIDSNVNGFKFAVGDSILEVFVVPSDWSPGTNIDVHAHWYSTNTTALRYVQFRAAYRLIATGEQITGGSSGNLDTGDILLPTTTKQTFESDHGSIPAASISAGDHLHIEMSRIASVGTAPAVADNPIFTHFDVEYQSDRRGS